MCVHAQNYAHTHARNHEICTQAQIGSACGRCSNTLVFLFYKNVKILLSQKICMPVSVNFPISNPQPWTFNINFSPLKWYRWSPVYLVTDTEAPCILLVQSAVTLVTDSCSSHWPGRDVWGSQLLLQGSMPSLLQINKSHWLARDVWGLQLLIHCGDLVPTG